MFPNWLAFRSLYPFRYNSSVLHLYQRKRTPAKHVAKLVQIRNVESRIFPLLNHEHKDGPALFVAFGSRQYRAFALAGTPILVSHQHGRRNGDRRIGADQDANYECEREAAQDFTTKGEQS